MVRIGKEASNFVRACEDIHALLAHGEILACDDRAHIEFSVIELLGKVRPANLYLSSRPFGNRVQLFH